MERYSLISVVALILLFHNELVSCASLKRKVEIRYWPDCGHLCKRNESVTNVVYSKATAKGNDILHYVFTTQEVPTVILAHTTGADTNLVFTWSTKENNDTNMTELIGMKFQDKGHSLKYQMAIGFTKLIEYNDFSDGANLDDYVKEKRQQWNVRDFGNVAWQTLNKIEENAFSFSTESYFSHITNESLSGNLTLSFRIPGKDGRDSELPNLKISPNETLFDFILTNYTPSFNHSRFAVEVISISQSGKEMTIENTHSIDDEHSPGVFRINNWYMDSAHKSKKGYMQWKPVCYLNKGRTRDHASKIQHYKLNDVDVNSNTSAFNNLSPLSMFLNLTGFNQKENFLFRATNVSFGLSKDGFYLKDNYTVWTAAIGYGTPPEDSISLTVIVIIACGLGLPVLLILFGGVFLIVKKVRRKNKGYKPIDSNVNTQSPQVN